MKELWVKSKRERERKRKRKTRDRVEMKVRMTWNRNQRSDRMTFVHLFDRNQTKKWKRDFYIEDCDIRTRSCQHPIVSSNWARHSPLTTSRPQNTRQKHISFSLSNTYNEYEGYHYTRFLCLSFWQALDSFYTPMSFITCLVSSKNLVQVYVVWIYTSGDDTFLLLQCISKGYVCSPWG